MPYTEEEDAFINLFIPSFFDIATSGSNESKLIDFPRAGFNSKLGSLEIQARCITAS